MGRLDLVRWVDLHPCVDSRGTLTAIEAEQTIPFTIQRVYFLHSLTAERGGHAHRDTEQLLIPVAGLCDVNLSDGTEHRSYRCDDRNKGLYIVPMIFLRFAALSPSTILLVLASTHYDKTRSIRSWDEYLAAIR